PAPRLFFISFIFCPRYLTSPQRKQEPPLLALRASVECQLARLPSVTAATIVSAPRCTCTLICAPGRLLRRNALKSSIVARPRLSILMITSLIFSPALSAREPALTASVVSG